MFHSEYFLAGPMVMCEGAVYKQAFALSLLLRSRFHLVTVLFLSVCDL